MANEAVEWVVDWMGSRVYEGCFQDGEAMVFGRKMGGIAFAREWVGSWGWWQDVICM